jgi:hypothetical protein
LENLKEEYHLTDLVVNGRIMLKQILKEKDYWDVARFSWLRIGSGGMHF